MSNVWRSTSHVELFFFSVQFFGDQHFNGHMIKFCISCGFDLSLNNTKIEPPLQRSLSYSFFILACVLVIFFLRSTTAGIKSRSISLPKAICIKLVLHLRFCCFLELCFCLMSSCCSKLCFVGLQSKTTFCIVFALEMTFNRRTLLFLRVVSLKQG